MSRHFWVLGMLPTADELSDLAAACVTCNALKWGYAPAGETRADRIADAARHIREQREAEEEKWNRYQKIVQDSWQGTFTTICRQTPG